MAIVEIQVNNVFEDQRMTTPLDGVRYTLRFYFSIREDCWHMDILDDNDAPLLMGLKLAPDINLTDRFAIENFPEGAFMAFDSSEAGLIAGRDDFGIDRRVKMYYQEAS